MNHGDDGLITPYPRDAGRLVLSVDDRGRELRLHETTPGFWLALRWDEIHLGWRGAVAWSLTPREWVAAAEAMRDAMDMVTLDPRPVGAEPDGTETMNP